MKDNDYEYQSSQTGSTFTAFLIGGLIGGAIALLYAPKSGKETREYLMNEGQVTAERVRRSIDMHNKALWQPLKMRRFGWKP